MAETLEPTLADEEKIRTRGVDPIGAWISGWRKLKTFFTVAQKKRKTSLSQQEFLTRAIQIQQEAAVLPDTRRIVPSLWKLESLGFSLLRFREPENTLNDLRIPLEVLPITHVGMGAASVEVSRFDPVQIRELIDGLCHPGFRLFGYESVGAMLAVYEPSRFPLDRKIMGLPSLERPEPAAFIQSFPPEIHRLICHGYGRLLYFKSRDIGAAVRAVLERPFLNLYDATQGSAFAYLMVNHHDLMRALSAGAGFGEPRLVAAFRRGLVYGLEFLEWVAPGFLKTLHPGGGIQKTLIEEAAADVTAARQGGVLPAFATGARI